MTSNSEIVDKVASIIRDTQSGTATLIQGYFRQVLDDLYKDVAFPELLSHLSKTIPTTQEVNFSATAGMNTYRIMDIRDPDGIGGQVQIVPNQFLDEIQIDQDSTSGHPKVAKIKNEKSLLVYPYGSSSVWEITYYKDPNNSTDFSAFSQTFPLSREAEMVLANGIIAEMLYYKDDDRAPRYEAKYEQGKRELRQRYDNPNGFHSMLPGNGLQISSADWMLN